jgi:serine protease Do
VVGAAGCPVSPPDKNLPAMPRRQPSSARLASRVASLQSSFVGLVFCALTWCAVLPAAVASEARNTPIVQAIASQRDAVVNIHGQKVITSADTDEPKRVNGMGTGAIIDSRGYVVTNYHVVEGVERIEVTLASGATTSAKLISHDLRTDLAIIKISPPHQLQVVRIGTSSDLMIGETVLALGNAYGYEHTVTRGIVSALHRSVEVSRTQRYDDLVQTDASINPGNSGGPLLNIDGEMIGVNVAVRAGAQGIGFAIPVDKVLEVVSELLSVERLDHTWHGIVARRDQQGGAVVTTVHRASPAEQVGVRAGDRIVRIGNSMVASQLDIERALLGRKAGERVNVEVVRAGGAEQIELPLAQLRSDAVSPEERCWRELGLRLEPMSSVRVRQLQNRYRGGLEVIEVRPDGPADEQGIQSGDILVGLHVWETIRPENVTYVLDRAQQECFGPLKFYVLRGRETLFGHLTWDTIRR